MTIKQEVLKELRKSFINMNKLDNKIILNEAIDLTLRKVGEVIDKDLSDVKALSEAVDSVFPNTETPISDKVEEIITSYMKELKQKLGIK